MRRHRRRALAAFLVLAGCSGAEKGPVLFRGNGLQVAPLSTNEQAAVQAAAVRAAFDIQPGLSLLVDPVYLPRTAGRVGGTPVPAPVIARLQEIGLTKGTCEPPRDAPKVVPQCKAELPGYVVRFSEVFGRGADSAQVYLAATQYRRNAEERAQVLSFEKAFQLVKSGQTWRVASEARLPSEGEQQ
jgi:hypothetical protein